MIDESDRLVAILEGSFIARQFPATWYGIMERNLVQAKTEREKLHDALKRRIEYNERKKANRIRNRGKKKD